MPNYHKPSLTPGQLVLMFNKKTLGIVTAVFTPTSPRGEACLYKLYYIMWMDTPTQRIQSIKTWNPYAWIDGPIM